MKILNLVILLGFLCANPAFSQNCDFALEDAKKLYDRALFKQVITKLSDACIEKLTTPRKLESYELLVLSLLEESEEEVAEEYIQEMLEISMDYEPHPSLPIKYQILFEKAKKEHVHSNPQDPIEPPRVDTIRVPINITLHPIPDVGNAARVGSFTILNDTTITWPVFQESKMPKYVYITEAPQTLPLIVVIEPPPKVVRKPLIRRPAITAVTALSAIAGGVIIGSLIKSPDPILASPPNFPSKP